MLISSLVSTLLAPQQRLLMQKEHVIRAWHQNAGGKSGTLQGLNLLLYLINMLGFKAGNWKVKLQ